MSEPTYTVEPDAARDECLWQHSSASGPLLYAWGHHPGAVGRGVPADLWPILTAVYAPTDEQVERLARHGRTDTERQAMSENDRHVDRLNARAVLAALRSLAGQEGES
jgi:hypothetical protein